MIIVNTNDRDLDNFINNKVYVFKADGEFVCIEFISFDLRMSVCAKVPYKNNRLLNTEYAQVIE